MVAFVLGHPHFPESVVWISGSEKTEGKSYDFVALHSMWRIFAKG
jgi:hypothetical protein